MATFAGEPLAHRISDGARERYGGGVGRYRRTECDEARALPVVGLTRTGLQCAVHLALKMCKPNCLDVLDLRSRCPVIRWRLMPTKGTISAIKGELRAPVFEENFELGVEFGAGALAIQVTLFVFRDWTAIVWVRSSFCSSRIRSSNIKFCERGHGAAGAVAPVTRAGAYAYCGEPARCSPSRRVRPDVKTTCEPVNPTRLIKLQLLFVPLCQP